MLRIGICDDEQNARFSLRCQLERILESRFVETEIFEFSSGDRFLEWFRKHAGELDLLFLDIEMGGTSGMDIAKELRTMDKNLQIVFVTGYPDYVFDGYSVSALGYLMKPAKQLELEAILRRALAGIQRGAEDVYICRNNDGMYRLAKSSILYFQSDKRKVICVTDLKEYSFYDKLDNIQNELGKPFIRIHQRYLVNAMSVRKMEGTSVQIADKSLPVSRNYQKEAFLALTRVLLE